MVARHTVGRGALVAGLLLAASLCAPLRPAFAEDFGDYEWGYDYGWDYYDYYEEPVAEVTEDVVASDGAAVPVADAQQAEETISPEEQAARLAELAAAPAPTITEAESAAMIDRAGNVLFQKDAERHMSPASITKVMTAVVALDSLQNGISLDDDVQITEPYLGELAAMAGFETGEHAVLRDLMRVMLVYSANDAAYNVALHVAGSIPAFADLMNAKAAEIGMTNSHFVNPHGMDDDGHYSCAIDLARLSKYALENYPFIAQTVSLSSVEIPIHGTPTVFNTTDALMGTYAGIRGVKTGSTDAYTFMGASARGDVGVYTAVLGCETSAGRFNDTAAMMDWAYAKYHEWQLAEDDWTVRVNPYALDMSYHTVVAASSDTQGEVWPEGGSASYDSVIARPDRLLDSGCGCGWSVWRQSERQMGTTTYATREMPVRVSSWPTFSLPLFVDTTMLGRSANA